MGSLYKNLKIQEYRNLEKSHHSTIQVNYCQHLNVFPSSIFFKKFLVSLIFYIIFLFFILFIFPLMFIVFFILLTLSFICPSGSLSCKVRFLYLRLFFFLNIGIYPNKLPSDYYF